MKKQNLAEKFQRGVKNLDTMYQNLSQTIGITASGWHHAAISDNFDVIVKETDNDWEAVATGKKKKKDYKDRLVMLDTVNQCGKKYMVLTYPARREKAQKLLDDRLKKYNAGIIPFVFGTEEELDVAKEQLMRQGVKSR